MCSLETEHESDRHRLPSVGMHLPMAGVAVLKPRCTQHTAGCPSGQRERIVNPSRKLHRFESYTCHGVVHSRETALQTVSDQRFV